MSGPVASPPLSYHGRRVLLTAGLVVLSVSNPGCSAQVRSGVASHKPSKSAHSRRAAGPIAADVVDAWIAQSKQCLVDAPDGDDIAVAKCARAQVMRMLVAGAAADLSNARVGACLVTAIFHLANRPVGARYYERACDATSLGRLRPAWQKAVAEHREFAQEISFRRNEIHIGVATRGNSAVAELQDENGKVWLLVAANGVTRLDVANTSSVRLQAIHVVESGEDDACRGGAQDWPASSARLVVKCK